MKKSQKNENFFDGNVTADPVNGTAISWNVIGLPRSVSAGADTAGRDYAADGTLLSIHEGTTGTAGMGHIGPMVYARDADGTLSLENAAWEGGCILPGTGSDRVLYRITDHLGSVRAVRDGTGKVLQRFDYYPSGSESRVWTAGTSTTQSALLHRFGGKEIAGGKAGTAVHPLSKAASAGRPYLDFGARLYDPRTAAWLSQDPMAEKYYGTSPYAYCAGNPISFVDEYGLDLVLFGANQSSITFRTDLVDLSINVSGIGIDWGGNHFLDGNETLSAALDLAGFLDPSGIADGANAILLASTGDYLGALQSGLSVLPFGDLAKAPKIGKDIRIIGDAIGLSSKGYLHRPYIRKWVREAVEAKAERDEFGRFKDANEGSPINGKYDLGHKYGEEFRKHKADAEARGLTQKEFNDLMNNPDLYQIEDPHINRSRKYEEKP